MKKDLSEEELRELAITCMEKDRRSLTLQEARSIFSHRDELQGFFEGMARYVEVAIPAIPEYWRRKASLNGIPTEKLREMLQALSAERFAEPVDDRERGSGNVEIYPIHDEIIILDILWGRDPSGKTLH